MTTTTSALALSWRRYDRPPATEHGRRESLIEFACELRSDYDERDRAIELMRVLRADLSEDEIVDGLDQLVELSREVADFSTGGSPERFDYAASEYEAHLTDLARVRTSYIFGDPRLPEHVWAKIVRNPETGCWVWTGTRTVGYGTVRAFGKDDYLHRVSYRLFVGAIPDGLQIDHLCHNRPCCNPAHLQVVTQRTNILRGDSPIAGNITKTHCRNGHEFTEANTYYRTYAKTGVTHRSCRTCNRERMQRGYERRRLAAIEKLARTGSAQLLPCTECGKQYATWQGLLAHQRNARHLSKMATAPVQA